MIIPIVAVDGPNPSPKAPSQNDCGSYFGNWVGVPVWVDAELVPVYKIPSFITGEISRLKY